MRFLPCVGTQLGTHHKVPRSTCFFVLAESCILTVARISGMARNQESCDFGFGVGERLSGEGASPPRGSAQVRTPPSTKEQVDLQESILDATVAFISGQHPIDVLEI